MPPSSAARATIILKVEPGEYCPEIALLVSGKRGFAISAFHSVWLMPVVKLLGLKLGDETSARSSPEWTSMTTAEALSWLIRALAYSCRPISMEST